MHLPCIHYKYTYDASAQGNSPAFRRAAGVDRNVERVKSLMAQCVDHMNREHDVHDLCSAWPRRLVELVAADGERLKY